jgi:hypothetical protein
MWFEQLGLLGQAIEITTPGPVAKRRRSGAMASICNDERAGFGVMFWRN